MDWRNKKNDENLAISKINIIFYLKKGHDQQRSFWMLDIMLNDFFKMANSKKYRNVYSTILRNC